MTSTFTRLIITSLTTLQVCSWNVAEAQPVPPADSNIPFLVTFGAQGLTKWGDDDRSQVFFLVVPANQKDPVYVRVFDPDIAGDHDELVGSADTKVKFSIYGGAKCFTDPAAAGTDPKGNYKSGTLIDSKTFESDPKYNNGWYTFGPIDPKEGEWVQEFSGNIFKIVAEGVSGDDGNLYRYFFSKNATVNIPIEGANAFSYEWTFRMPDQAGAVCHLYPYVSEDVISVQQFNFDWDNDGIIKIVSYEKKGEHVAMGNEDEWKESTHPILPKERNGSLDVQFVRSKADPKKNNNICFSIKNQYGQYMKFYTIPIGGAPKFKYDNNLIDRYREGERYNNSKVYQKKP